MCGMNRIYWDIDKISMLTDHLDASAHSPGMIQFFLCLEDELEIRVGKEKIRKIQVIRSVDVLIFLRFFYDILLQKGVCSYG